MEGGKSAGLEQPSGPSRAAALHARAAATVRRKLRFAPSRGALASARVAAPAAEQFPTPERACRDCPQEGLLRAADLVLATAALVFLAPVLAAIALGVRLSSPGPVFFRQTRFGRYGKPFRIYKFRTMVCTEDGPAIRQACRDDARVTPFGRVLRRLSLDELPQLLNVLQGDMSLVGPRPHPVALDWRFCGQLPYYGMRFGVRPGITGLAQVRGLRGEIFHESQIRQRVLHDVVYVRRRCLKLYFGILAATLALVFFQPEAY